MFCLFAFSYTSHSVPPEAAEAGTDQRLPAYGGRVYQEPGADEAPGRETGGQHLHLKYHTSFCVAGLGEMKLPKTKQNSSVGDLVKINY